MAGVMQEYANECVLMEKIETVDSLIKNYNFSLEDACKVERITVEQYKYAKEKEVALI